mgnify:CR=1 FL=1
MRRPHDVGGLEGFGPIVNDQGDYHPFKEEWQRRMFGITMMAIGKGLVPSVDEFRWGVEQQTPEEYFRQSYFERWIDPVQRALFHNGELAPGELERRTQEMAAGAPVPRAEDPAFADGFVQFCLTCGPFSKPPVPEEARFQVGQRVRVKDVEAPAHTRLPHYARGKTGVIERIQDLSVLPDVRATRNGEIWEHVYMIVFDAQEVFGSRAEPGQQLTLDVWESYIEPLEA